MGSTAVCVSDNDQVWRLPNKLTVPAASILKPVTFKALLVALGVCTLVLPTTAGACNCVVLAIVLLALILPLTSSVAVGVPLFSAILTLPRMLKSPINWLRGASNFR